jgi:hypothetical protein
LSRTERDVQTVGEEGDEDGRLDTSLALMKKRPNRKIVLERFEGFLDRDQAQVVLPELGGICFGEIGTQQIAPFALANLA